MGTENKAPAEVLIVSEFIRALPLCGRIIPATPVADAERMIAPKLRVSVILSRSKNIGAASFSNTFSIKDSKSQ